MLSLLYACGLRLEATVRGYDIIFLINIEKKRREENEKCSTEEADRTKKESCG